MQPLSRKHIAVRFADFFFIIAMIIFILVVFRNYAISGEIVRDYLLPGDGMGHAYKVEMIKRMLFNERMLLDWDDGWYAGYHPFHFYSPLGYVPYVFLNMVLNDLGAAFRAGIVIGFIVSAIGMYFLVLTILHNRASLLAVKLAATAAALFYSLNPRNTLFIALGGELPALYSIAIMPVSLLFLIRLLRSGSRKTAVGYALVTATAFLTHAEFGLLAFAGGFLIFISETIREVILSLEPGESGLSMSYVMKKQILKTIACYFLSIILLGGLVAFWMIPFFAEANSLASVWARPPASQFSIGYLDIVVRHVSIKYWRYIGATAVIAMPLALIDREKWRDVGCFVFVFFVIWLLALGPNTPVYYLLPFEELFRPERSLSLLALLVGCVLPYSLLAIRNRLDEGLRSRKLHRAIRHALPSAVTVVLILLVVFDISISFGQLTLMKGDPEFIDLSDLIRSLDGESEGARMAFVENDSLRTWPTYVLYTFSPTLTNVPYSDGYYRSGSKLSYVMFYSSTIAVQRNETKVFLGRFVDHDVKYVVVNVRDKLMLNNLLRTGQFRLIETVGKYRLLEFLGRKGFIIEGRPDILAIGMDDYTAKVAKGTLDIFSQNFTVTRGQLTYIDDYTLDDLKGHDAAVIYGIKYRDMSAAEKLLTEYVKGGGFLIIDADSSISSSGKFMGVSYHLTPSIGSNITYSKLGPTLGLEVPQWTGVVYEGLDESFLVAGENKTVAGRKNGVVFLGGNLFYYAALTNDAVKISFLEQLVAMGLKTDGGQSIDYDVLEKRPDYREFRIQVASDAMIRLSTTTSPYWKVYVDGVPVKVVDQDGFIRIFVEAGEHVITLKYSDTPLKTASNAITVATLVLCVLAYRKTQLRVVIRKRENCFD